MSALPDDRRAHLASAIYAEVRSLDESTLNALRLASPVPPEHYRSEMEAFQAWMTLAHANAANPAIVRAQVMTELYVSFVWLRDSLWQPVADVIPAGAAARVTRFFTDPDQRRLRNAIAHGRWTYLPGCVGIQGWDNREPPYARFEVAADILGKWQTLARGSSIAILLALTDSD